MCCEGSRHRLGLSHDVLRTASPGEHSEGVVAVWPQTGDGDGVVTCVVSD